MFGWELPTSLEVGGTEWDIRTDFRAILSVLANFDDSLQDFDEKAIYCLDVMYKDFDNMPEELWQEALEKAFEFISAGRIDEDHQSTAKLMDWEKDASLYFPAVNKVMNCEVRALKYLHWWTFFGAYMEVGQGAFSYVVSIRDKRARRVKLDKEEERFYRENRNMIDFRPKLTAEEKEEKAKLLELLDG